MIDSFTVFSRATHIFLAIVVVLSSACSSGVTKIERYGFKIMDEAPGSWQPKSIDSQKTIALYSVRLPSYLDTPSIVSHTNTQKIRVSRGHVWAGDLGSEVTRILSANLSLLLPENHILRFPWGQNIDPDYSIRISVDEMSGEQGGEVVLKAHWQIFHPDGNSKYANKVFKAELKEPSLSDSYDDYVAACNRLVEKFSLVLASELQLLLI